MKIKTAFCEFECTPETFGQTACDLYEDQRRAVLGNRFTATDEALWVFLRDIRNQLLDNIDIRYFNADRVDGMTGQEKQALRAVKKALKDLPATYTNPRLAQLPANMPNGTYNVMIAK